MASSNSLNDARDKAVREELRSWPDFVKDPDMAKVANPLASYNSILEEAHKAVNGDRQENYGSQTTNFKHIAQMWAVILHRDVSVQEVAMCMIALKLARLIKTGGGHRDSIVDIAGYAECLAKVNVGL